MLRHWPKNTGSPLKLCEISGPTVPGSKLRRLPGRWMKPRPTAKVVSPRHTLASRHAAQSRRATFQPAQSRRDPRAEDHDTPRQDGFKDSWCGAYISEQCSSSDSLPRCTVSAVGEDLAPQEQRPEWPLGRSVVFALDARMRPFPRAHRLRVAGQYSESA